MLLQEMVVRESVDDFMVLGSGLGVSPLSVLVISFLK